MANVAWYAFDTAGVNEPLGFSVPMTEIAPSSIAAVITDELDGAPAIDNLVNANGAAGYAI